MNKSRFFLFLNLFCLQTYLSHSAPTIFFPKLASSRGLDTIVIAFFFSVFPLGAFPASLCIGKLMRFYRKDQLLLIFNVLLSLAKLCTGILYYIEDINLFLFIAFFSRFVTGIAQGCIIPTIYSYIPELFPENMMVKFGIIEILGSIGVILGGFFGTFIYGVYGYFFVFAIFSALNLIFGTALIFFNLKNDFIERLSEENKNSLPLKDALFHNSNVLMNLAFLFFIFLPSYMILPGYELYISTVSNSTYVSSMIYSLIFLGMIFGVLVISQVYKNNVESKMLFLCSLLIIIALYFYGPDPIFEIFDKKEQLVFMGIAFFVSGIVAEVVFLIITKVIIHELLNVFPGDKNLCGDFANGLFTACLSLDQLIGPIVGAILNDYIGYIRTGSFFVIFLLSFFVPYWVLQFMKPKMEYNEMLEEENPKMQTDGSV